MAGDANEWPNGEIAGYDYLQPLMRASTIVPLNLSVSPQAAINGAFDMMTRIGLTKPLKKQEPPPKPRVQPGQRLIRLK